MLTREQKDYLDELGKSKIYIDNVPDEMIDDAFCIALFNVAIREAAYLSNDKWTNPVCEAFIDMNGNLEHIPQDVWSDSLYTRALKKNGRNLEIIPETLRTVEK